MVKADGLNKGFTLIEVIIVVFVIGVLATVSFVAYQGFQRNARDKSVLSDIDAMDGVQALYGKQNNASGRVYYSGNPSDVEALDFEPSRGNVIDVVIDSTDYCIRGYNPDGNKNSIDNSYTKESSTGACSMLFASVSAGGLGSPIGWWRMNGDANDNSGQGLNGSVYGANLTTGQNGSANSAYRFNGGQYIMLPSSHNTAEGTVSLWFRPDSSQPSSTGSWYIFSVFQTATNSRVYIRTNATGSDVSGIMGSGAIIGSVNISSNNWHNIALGWSGATAKLYVDGQDVTTNTSFNGLSSSGPAYLGCIASAAVECISGDIDDVRIYDYQLNPAQASKIYSAGAH